MSFLINNLKEVPNIGVSAFVDNANKAVFVFFSNSLFTLFCTHIYKLKLGIHDNKQLQEAFNNNSLDIVHLNSYKEDPGTIELRSEYTRRVDQYVSMGYKNMRDGYKAISYRIKTYVLTDYRDIHKMTPLVYVVGRSLNSGEILLGVFDSIPESEEWVKCVYGDKRNEIIPQFCDNDLTKAYIQKYGYEMIRERSK